MTWTSVEKISPRTYSWPLGDRSPSGKWSSFGFSVYGKNNRYLFEICQTSPEKGELYLLEPKLCEKKCIKVRVVLMYKEKTKEFNCENVIGIPGYSFRSYYLREIKTKGLLKVTCTFLNFEELYKVEKSSIKQATRKAEIEEMSKQGDHEDGTNKTDHIHNRDLVALSEDLKGAFLCDEDSDVAFRIGPQTYPAHTFILRRRSPVFRAMLTHDMLEKNQGAIDISDCDPHIFLELLRYLYTGKLNNITKENVFELYHISDKYDVKEMKMDCVDFIVRNLNIDVICDVIVLAMRHSEREMLTHASKFFVDNAKDIVLTKDWKSFITENPIQANELIIKAFNNDSRK